MRNLRSKDATKALGGIDHRIKKYRHLEPDNLAQSRPRIVGRPQKNHRDDYRREHKRELEWIDYCAEGDTCRSGSKSDQKDKNRKKQKAVYLNRQVLPHDYPGDWKNKRPGDPGLQR